MAILVTGGAGYIGSHTVVELLSNNKDVVIVDNLSNSSPEVLERIFQISGKNPKFYRLDVCDKNSLRQVFEENDIEAVIHFAGFKAVGESVQKPTMYYRNNLDSTLSLVETMNEFGVKKIIFSSSATVYGEKNPSPYREDMPTGETTNPYGSTKVMGERILCDLADSDPDWRVTLLRYFNPIGAHQSGLIGEDPNGIPNNLMPFISQVAIGKREKLTVFGDNYDTPDGTCQRDYIHVVDLAKGHIRALENIPGYPAVKVYNLGSGNGTSVMELVKAFEKINGVKIPFEIGERRSGDLARSWADATKALNELNWKTEKTIEDMCRDSWNWQSKNPNGYKS